MGDHCVPKNYLRLPNTRVSRAGTRIRRVRADSQEVDRQRSRRIAIGGLAAIAIVVAGIGLVVPGTKRPHGTVVATPSSTPSATTTPLPTPIPTGPVAGVGVSVADDPATHGLVLFGGVDSSDETWLWDGRRWTPVTPKSSPPARAGAAIAYDPATRLLMLYGGEGSNEGTQFNDTWAWNGTTWRRLDGGGPSGPFVGNGASMAWDGARGQMLLVTSAGTDTDGETWSWNGTRWVREPRGDLVALVIAGTMAYDPRSETVLMITPLIGDNAHSAVFGWNGSSWHPLLAQGPELDGVALGEPVNGPGGQVNDVVACSSVTSSATFVLQASCWEWETTRWAQLQAAIPAKVATPVTVAAEVDDMDRAQLLIIGWLATPPVPNTAEPLYVWAWDGIKWTLLA